MLIKLLKNSIKYLFNLKFSFQNQINCFNNFLVIKTSMTNEKKIHSQILFTFYCAYAAPTAAIREEKNNYRRHSIIRHNPLNYNHASCVRTYCRREEGIIDIWNRFLCSQLSAHCHHYEVLQAFGLISIFDTLQRCAATNMIYRLHS